MSRIAQDQELILSSLIRSTHAHHHLHSSPRPTSSRHQVDIKLVARSLMMYFVLHSCSSLSSYYFQWTTKHSNYVLTRSTKTLQESSAIDFTADACSDNSLTTSMQYCFFDSDTSYCLPTDTDSDSSGFCQPYTTLYAYSYNCIAHEGDSYIYNSNSNGVSHYFFSPWHPPHTPIHHTPRLLLPPPPPLPPHLLAGSASSVFFWWLLHNDIRPIVLSTLQWVPGM